MQKEKKKLTKKDIMLTIRTTIVCMIPMVILYLAMLTEEKKSGMLFLILLFGTCFYCWYVLWLVMDRRIYKHNYEMLLKEFNIEKENDELEKAYKMVYNDLIKKDKILDEKQKQNN